jgi:N-acylneuraminate cytidylyltransferase/CMP-N,N'-diacetyllegionaminic acid synthase
MVFDIVMDLDVTAPLRNVDDIRNSIRVLEESGAENVASGMPARRSPYFNLAEMDERGRVHLSKKPEKPIVRRQDSPRCFDLNASVFAWTRKGLMENDVAIGLDTVLYEMPEERSIDIDGELDFQFVEFVMGRTARHE